MLTFCSELDPVAYRFRERLVAIYTKLASHEPEESASPLKPGQDHTDRYLFIVPEDAHDDQKKTSWMLLNLLCKPFIDPADRVDSEEDVRKHIAECPLRHNHSFFTQLMEQLQWKYETTQPFNWDVHSLLGREVGGVNNEQQGHMFLGNAEPHHWKDGPRVMRPGWQEDSS